MSDQQNSTSSSSSDATTTESTKSNGDIPEKFKGALYVPPIYDIIMSSQRIREAQPKYRHTDALHREVPVQNTNQMGIEHLTRMALPYAQPWWLSAHNGMDPPPDFSWLTNSCSGKAAIGLIGGGVMGLLMGVFLGAMSDATPPVQVIAGKEVPQAPLKEQIKVTMRATAEKSRYWCRQFAFITGVFGGTDCLVEKFRGKHDIWNAVASGCITGAALQAKQGPQAAAMGCGGFAAFSLVIEKVMGNH